MYHSWPKTYDCNMSRTEAPKITKIGSTRGRINRENVEVVDGKVTVCRDAVKGKCMRPNCKYYHPEVGSSGVASSTKSTR
ncbi:Protein muscleblind [Stylophora pistillata]|uniref:Protein muscleblind n=1 Tax=Stylophora pistillata TaxID=50429 RepID=A0A2B4RZ61_STYPI|nr:Protein muscleblind [Stylophora pistillata]